MIRKFTPILNLVTTAFLLCSIAFAQSIPLKNLKLKENKSVSTDTIKSNLTEKSPLLAGTLSFIVPGVGLGQMYNGQEGKFLRHSLISLGCVLLYFMSGGTLNGFVLAGTEGINFSMAFVLLAYTGNWAWSVVDAIVSANNINKQVKLQKYRSDIHDKIKLGIILNKNRKLNFNFVYEL